MLGKLIVAFSLLATPALASEPVPPFDAPAKQEYTIKKVCRTVEVAGSFIPRRTCVNRKIPVKAPDADANEADNGKSGAADGSETGQKEQ